MAIKNNSVSSEARSIRLFDFDTSNISYRFENLANGVSNVSSFAPG